ncbi:MAG: U32 family peptidase [Rhodocyclaceae bacterium]|nr:U32 family peptidase [Rhodocyclaceae bacterium]
MTTLTAKPFELVCPAGALPALKAAVDNGADCVYTGLKDNTNARNFTGLNFDDAQLREGIRYAHDRRAKVLLALNTYPQTATWSRWTAAVDKAADFGVDAIILADPGLMEYAKTKHPQLRLHLSVQGSATSYEAINFYHEQFGIQRAVLPRVLAMAQVEHVVKNTPVEIEVFGFGGLCVMVEGRCALSAYVTFAEGEKTGYPTLCKGRFEVNDETYYAIEEPTSLNTLELLPKLMEIGVKAVKIEGRQRSPAYVAQVTRVWREAIDSALRNRQDFSVREAWMAELNKVSEGNMHTLGAYYRPWK